VKRGDIWLVQADPALNPKTRKARPCVVISPPEMLDHLCTVLVAPMASKGLAAPFRVPVTHAGVRGLILLDQLRAVDKARLTQRLGTVSAKTLTAILDTLQEVFAA
jgi:mRNA interferase MazF